MATPSTYERSGAVAAAMELPLDAARATLERARLHDAALSGDELAHAASTFDRLGAQDLRAQLDAI